MTNTKFVPAPYDVRPPRDRAYVVTPVAAARGRHSFYAPDLVSDLVDRAGDWALVRSGPGNVMRQEAHRIKNGKIPVFAGAGVFDSVTRKDPDSSDDRLVHVYARFLGKSAELR